MKYFRVSKIFLIVLFCLLLQHKAVCQNELNSDTLEVNENDEEYYQENDSVDNVYPDYYRVTISPGYSRNDNMKLSSYSKQFYINISYSNSNFGVPLEYIPTQIGFFNEIGLNNTSPYFNIGPELRIVQDFYLISYAGISLIPFPKDNDNGISIILYLGAAAGYIMNLNEDINIIFEVASDFIKLKQYQNNTYMKIGISYNLLYPL
ncbi:MAG: hypothetical protein ABR980_08995 [Ignavibacteriaceae bacterium]|jgi:hypothetical protein